MPRWVRAISVYFTRSLMTRTRATSYDGLPGENLERGTRFELATSTMAR